MNPIFVAILTITACVGVIGKAYRDRKKSLRSDG